MTRRQYIQYAEVLAYDYAWPVRAMSGSVASMSRRSSRTPAAHTPLDPLETELVSPVEASIGPLDEQV